MKQDSRADYILPGTAIDQEAVFRIRKQIEEMINETMGKFDHTDLFIQMKEDSTFEFELHFFREPNGNITAQD